MAVDDHARSAPKHTHHNGAACSARSGKTEERRNGRGKPPAHGALVTTQRRDAALYHEPTFSIVDRRIRLKGDNG
jgi:hypothetical protein